MKIIIIDDKILGCLSRIIIVFVGGTGNHFTVNLFDNCVDNVVHDTIMIHSINDSID